MQAALEALVDAADVGLQHLAHVRTYALQLRLGGAPKAKASAHAVDGQAIVPDELRDRPGSHPPQQLQLERAVLRVAEPEAEPGVRRAVRIHVRDPPAISPDGD